MRLHHSGAPAEEEPERGIPSWQEMWRRAYDALRLYYARGWQQSDWEDMAQEVVLKVIKASADGRVEERRFDALLQDVAKKVAIDRWRARSGRKGTRNVSPLEAVEDLEDQRAKAQLDSIIASVDVQTLLEGSAFLSPNEREVLRLTYWYDLSSRQIAEVLDKSDATVRMWHSKALKKLQNHCREAQ